jgi:hypothetical protein
VFVSWPRGRLLGTTIGLEDPHPTLGVAPKASWIRNESAWLVGLHGGSVKLGPLALRASAVWIRAIEAICA